METVIQDSRRSAHIINKYNFKVLSSSTNVLGSAQESDEEFVTGIPSVSDTSNKAQATASDSQESVEAAAPQENVLSKSSKDELIESLLKKTDEMSSNFIKMQMKLEAKEEEYKAALEAAKAEAFEAGKEAGMKEAEALVQGEHSSLMQQFSNSVQTLDNSTKEFATSIEGIKEELIHAALDIAKEVIVIETSEHGQQIATTLAEDLIKQIQTSAAVTIKVNPQDKVAIEQSLGTLENVSVISDNAVSNGGVVILSDAGNIDGDIMKRYERVKRAALNK